MLSRPKILWGWGLKNIFWFRKALAAKKLWGVLINDGLWSLVIKGKYLKNKLLIDWIHRMVVKHYVSHTSSSMVWKGLMASFPWIFRWIMWKAGNGFHIVWERIPSVMVFPIISYLSL